MGDKMQEYKSVAKYLKKEQSLKKKSSFLVRLFKKILICIVFLLIGLIILKMDKNSSNKIHEILYEHNINFAYINSLYKKYFGKLLPSSEKTKQVFLEDLEYTDSNIYYDGVSLLVGDNYLVPILDSGVVIFIGNKDNYNNTVIIQGENGINIWYGNVSNLNVTLYDYVEKGEFLGEVVDKNLYLVYEKDGKYLDYKDYLL